MSNDFLHIIVDSNTNRVRTKWGSQDQSVSINDVSSITVDGSDLFKQTIHRDVYEAARQKLQAEGQPLRIVVHQDADTNFLNWESLHDGDDYLVDKQIPVLRATYTPLTNQPIVVQGTIRILMINMNDSNNDEQMLRQVERDSSGIVEAVILRNPSRTTLLQTIRDAQNGDAPFHIWHFCGVVDADSGLVFDDRSLKTTQWKSMLQDYPELKLVTLNLDETVAKPQHLGRINIPHLVTSTAKMDADVRHSFFKSLYENILKDGIFSAFQEAQANIRSITFEPMEWTRFTLLTQTFEDRLIQPISVNTGTSSDIPIERDQVFISYSHQDAKWCEALMKYLDPLRKSHTIKAWIDKDILPGSDWNQEINNALQRMKVAILLASPPFFNSTFILEHELPYILDCYQNGDCIVIWVAVSAHTYEFTPLEPIQAIHPYVEPLDRMSETEAQDVMLKIVRAVAAALKTT